MTRRTIATLVAAAAVVAGGAGAAQALDGGEAMAGPCPVVKCKSIA